MFGNIAERHGAERLRLSTDTKHVQSIIAHAFCTPRFAPPLVMTD
jgi:hypothetical protein